MTPHELVNTIFATLFVMVFAWFVLVTMLCARLERLHSEKYESMGKPSLINLSDISSSISVMFFILAREHTELGDGYLSKLSDFMLVFFVAYVVLFFSLIYLGFKAHS